MTPVQLTLFANFKDRPTRDILGVIDIKKSRKGKYYSRVLFFDSWTYHHDLLDSEQDYIEPFYGPYLESLFYFLVERLLEDEEEILWNFYEQNKDQFKGISFKEKHGNTPNGGTWTSWEHKIDPRKATLTELNFLLEAVGGHVRIGTGDRNENI